MCVFTGLGLGVALGTVLHLIYGVGSPIITSTNAYLNIVGSGYVKLLQMIVMPLIIVSIVGAIVKLKNTAALRAPLKIHFSSLCVVAHEKFLLTYQTYASSKFVARA